MFDLHDTKFSIPCNKQLRALCKQADKGLLFELFHFFFFAFDLLNTEKRGLPGCCKGFNETGMVEWR